MTSEQTPTYLLRLRERIAAIRQNSKNLKNKLAGSMGRSGLGWRGESARQTLAAELSAHFAQDDVRGQVGIPRPARLRSHLFFDGEGEDWDKDQNESNARSDSMEPMRDGDGGKEEKKESYVGYHSLNSGRMRKKRLEEVQGMYLSGGRFATIRKSKGRDLKDLLQDLADTGDGNKEPISRAQDLADDETELSSNPYPEDDYLLPRYTRSTRSLHPSNAETNFHEIETESQCTNPYPSDAPTSPPQPPRSLQPRTAPFSRAITPSPVPSKFSVWPSNRTISPISPLDASQHRLSPAPVSSSFASFQSRSQSGRLHRQRSLQIRAAGKDERYDDHDGDGIEYPPDHPFYGLNAQQRRAYWSELSSYHSSSRSLGFRSEPRILRHDPRIGRSQLSVSLVQDRLLLSSAGASYEPVSSPDLGSSFLASLSPEARRLAEEAMGRESDLSGRPVRSVRSQGDIGAAMLEETEDGERRKKRSGVDRLLHTLSCRPGTCTPDCPARPVGHEIQPVATVAAPKRYTMAYLAKKLRYTPTTWRRTKGGQEQTHKGLQAPAVATDGASTQLDTNAQRQSTGSPKGQQTNDEIASHGAEPPIADLSSKTNRATGPPVHLSKMIQRAPDSIRSPSPASCLTALPEATATSSAPQSPLQEAVSAVVAAAAATSEPPQLPQPRSQSSGSSLSDRLAATRLEDIRLRFETAQEIRDLMLDLDRDRRQSHTLTRQHSAGITALPGGFTRPSSAETRSQHSTASPRGALERHFQSQQGSGSVLRSQASNWTLPRSYKAPETHSSTPPAPASVLRARSSLAEVVNASEEGDAISVQDCSIIETDIHMDILIV